MTGHGTKGIHRCWSRSAGVSGCRVASARTRHHDRHALEPFPPVRQPDPLTARMQMALITQLGLLASRRSDPDHPWSPPPLGGCHGIRCHAERHRPDPAPTARRRGRPSRRQSSEEQQITRAKRPTVASERPTWTCERPISPSHPRSDGPVGPFGPLLEWRDGADSGDIAQSLGDVVGDDDASDGTGRFNSVRAYDTRCSDGSVQAPEIASSIGQ